MFEFYLFSECSRGLSSASSSEGEFHLCDICDSEVKMWYY